MGKGGGGNQCMHSKQVNTKCPTLGVLSWVYTHTKLVVLLEERSHTSAEYTQNCC